METPQQKMGGKSRRTRKLNTWAKAAGEYYREHKDEFKSFSEVLSSPKLKEYYDAKYKNKKGGEGIHTNTNNLSGGKNKRKSTKKRGGNGKEITIDTNPTYPEETTAGGEPQLEGGLEGPETTISSASTEEITQQSNVVSGGKKSRKNSKKSSK